jgi:hypothetical protein
MIYLDNSAFFREPLALSGLEEEAGGYEST